VQHAGVESEQGCELLEELAGEHGLILARDARMLGCYDQVRHAASRSRLVRVWRGAFMLRTRWDALSPDARYLAKVHAVASLSREPLVFSHWSAAALWRLPIVGQWPATVHCLQHDATGGRSSSTLIRHAGLGRFAVASTDGTLCTSAADTVLSLASTARFTTAVAFADAALHASHDDRPLCTHRQLEDRLAELYGRKGSRRAAEVSAFADGRSGSPGESASRATMCLCGVEIPDLQVAFRDRKGLAGIVDFYWRSARLVGEFDGKAKYLRDEYTNGLGTGEIVLKEKGREDRIRALGTSFRRWGWRAALSPIEMRRMLTAAGAPLRGQRVFFTA